VLGVLMLELWMTEYLPRATAPVDVRAAA